MFFGCCWRWLQVGRGADNNSKSVRGTGRRQQTRAALPPFAAGADAKPVVRCPMTRAASTAGVCPLALLRYPKSHIWSFQ